MSSADILTKSIGDGFERIRFDTIPQLLRAFGINVSDEEFAKAYPFITHDNSAKPEYRVSRRSTHDGTLIFTKQSIENAVWSLITRTTYFVPTGEWDRIDDVRYVVTGISIARVFGEVKLPCSETHRYPGMREAVRIGVRCIH